MKNCVREDNVRPHLVVSGQGEGRLFCPPGTSLSLCAVAVLGALLVMPAASQGGGALGGLRHATVPAVPRATAQRDFAQIETVFGPPQVAPRSQSPALDGRQMKALLNSLPSCSSLLDASIRVRPSATYMPLMRRLGVARAYFVSNGLADTRRIYFRRLDGPHAIIRNPAWLRRIVSSGLQADLDKAMLERFRSPEFHPIIGDADPAEGFFAQPVLEPPSKARRSLAVVSLFALQLNVAIATDDGPGVRDSIDKVRRAGGDLNLNSFLIESIATPYDNRAALTALLAAGADPNTGIGAPTIQSPLMGILGALPDYSPCNLEPLLAAGARLDVRNAAGQTPLDLAKKSRNAFAIRAIEAAVARQAKIRPNPGAGRGPRAPSAEPDHAGRRQHPGLGRHPGLQPQL